MSQRFDDDEMTYFDKEGKDFIERSVNWRTWCPFESIPFVRDTEWKILNTVREPVASLDGAMTSLTATTYTTDTAKVVHFATHVQWSEAEIEASRRTGNKINTDEIRLGLQKMDQRVERFIVQGAMTWDGVAGNGLLTNASDVADTKALDAIYWSVIGTTGALGGPFEHAQAGYDALTAAGYDEPFTMLVSDNLRVGLTNPNSDFGDKSAKQAIMDTFGIKFVFMAIAPGTQTQDDLRTYSMPVAAGDDGRWALCKADSNNFALQEIFPPTVQIFPDMLQKEKMYWGRIETAVALRITHDDSVVDEDQVDLAA